MNRVLERTQEETSYQNNNFRNEAYVAPHAEQLNNTAYGQSMNANGFGQYEQNDTNCGFVQPEFLQRANRYAQNTYAQNAQNNYAENTQNTYAEPKAYAESNAYSASANRNNFRANARFGNEMNGVANNYSNSVDEYCDDEQQASSNCKAQAISTVQPVSRKNTKMKLLIAVYFFIIAVISTLLLVNMATSNKNATSATRDNTTQYNQEAVSYATDSDGKIVEMKEMPIVVDSNVDIQTNWFDKVCGKIEGLMR